MPFKVLSPKKHLKEWLEDPMNLSHQITPQNLLAKIQIMQTLDSNKIMEGIECSSLVITVGKDTVVDNNSTQSMFARMKTHDKTMITYHDLDHAIF